MKNLLPIILTLYLSFSVTRFNCLIVEDDSGKRTHLPVPDAAEILRTSAADELRWSRDAPIAYNFEDDRFSFNDRYRIENALRTLSARIFSCLTFKLRSRETTYIHFTKNSHLSESLRIGYRNDTSQYDIGLTNYALHINIFYPLFCTLGLMGYGSKHCTFQVRQPTNLTTEHILNHDLPADTVKDTGLTVNDILQLQILYNCSMPTHVPSPLRKQLAMPNFSYRYSASTEIHNFIATLELTDYVHVLSPPLQAIPPFLRFIEVSPSVTESDLEQIFTFISKTEDSVPITLQFYFRPITDMTFDSLRENITGFVLLNYVNFSSSSLRSVNLPKLLHLRFNTCDNIYLYKNDLAGFSSLRMLTVFNSSLAEIHNGAFNGLAMLQLLIMHSFPLVDGASQPQTQGQYDSLARFYCKCAYTGIQHLLRRWPHVIQPPMEKLMLVPTVYDEYLMSANTQSLIYLPLDCDKGDVVNSKTDSIAENTCFS